MRKTKGVDDSVKTTLVVRAAFEDAVRKLLKSPPISKAEISRKLRGVGYRPLKPSRKPGS
jgi:hypothetical protein